MAHLNTAPQDNPTVEELSTFRSKTSRLPITKPQ
jgi:hypothetical protein